MGGTWAGGAGHAMLTYHSNNLLQIQVHALSKKALILGTYVYLQDAEAKSFYTPAMTEALWNKVASSHARIQQLQDKLASKGKNKAPAGDRAQGERGKGGGPPDKDKRPKCSHCKTAEFHELLGIGIGKQDCPLEEHRPPSAQKIALKVLDAHKNDSSNKPAQDILVEVLA